MTPHDANELTRTCTPLSVYECDLPIRTRSEDTGATVLLVMKRVRRVRVLDPDGVHVHEITSVVGPATGLSDVFMPCHGEVEMAQVLDALDEMPERAKRRRVANRGRAEARNVWFREQLRATAEELVKRRAGVSSFGFGGQILRSSQ